MSIRSGWVFACVLAVWLAGGCATGRTDEAELLVRGTPLLDRLGSAKLSESGVRGKALVAAARADKALSEARPVDAVAALGEALAALPEDAPACGVRGHLLYLKGLAASFGGAGAFEMGFKELGEVCLDRPAGGPGEIDARLFLQALARTDELGGANQTSESGADKSLRSALAGVADKRRDRELQRIANQLGGERGRLIAALALFLRESGAVNTDVCDAAFPAAHREKLAAAWGELERLGRPDLGLSYWAMAVVGDDGRLRSADVERLTDWLGKPENRWLSGEAASRFLSAVRYSADWADPLLTLPVCRVYFDSVTRAVAEDLGEGAAARNVSRMMAALQAAGSCLNSEELARLTDAVLSGAVKEGKAGILPVLGGVAVNLALTFVDGRTDLIPVVLGQLSSGLERLKGQLTGSDEDRVVAEIARLAGALEPFLRSWDLGALGAEIERSAAALDAVAAGPVSETSPDLVRLAQPIRAALVALLAGEQLLEGRTADALATLNRLERTLPKDLSALLTWFGQPDHSPAILAIFSGVRKTVQAADRDDAAAYAEALGTLETASIPGTHEAGWWAIGLDAARFLSFDLLAIVSHGKAAPEVVTRALARAEELSGRVADELSLEVEPPPAIEAIVRLLPAVHRAIPELLGPDDPNVASRVASLLEQPLREVLGDTLEDGSERTGNVADLVIDLLRAAAGVGLVAVVEKPQEAVVGMAKLLEERLGRYPADIRAFLGLAVAAGKFLAAEDAAPSLFDAARPLLEKKMPHLAFVPDVIVLAARKATMALEEQLAVLDRILEAGQGSEGCGKGHVVHSLLPYKVKLLARLGRFSEAAASWQHFDTLVRAGFSGSGSLSCVLESNSGNVTFTANIGSTLEGLLLSGKQEGTFNLGLGGRWLDGRLPTSGDSLACHAVVPQAIRHDRIAEAHLAFAAYALLAGDDRLAHRAMMSAYGSCMALRNVSTVSLGRFLGGHLEEPRKKFDFRLLAWTSLLARFRGQTEIARALDACGIALGQEAGVAWRFAQADLEEPPEFLADFPALKGFGLLVWHQTLLTEDALVKDYEKEMRTWNKTARIFPDWGIRMGLDSLLLDIDSTRGDQGFRVVVPDARKLPLAHALASLTNLRLEDKAAVSDELSQKLLHLAAPALEAGLYMEVAAAATSLAGAARWAEKIPLGISLIEAVRERIPAQGAEMAQIEAIQMEAVLLQEAGELATLAKANAVLVENATHLMTAGDNLQRRFQLVSFLGLAGDGAAMQLYLSQMMPMLHRAAGSANLDYYSLLSAHAALAILGGDLAPATAATLASFGKSFGANADVIGFFELLAGSVDAADRKRLAGAYLVFQFQNGPFPSSQKGP